MSENYLIVSDPDVCDDKLRIIRSRVPVEDILEFWELGYTAGKILQ